MHSDNAVRDDAGRRARTGSILYAVLAVLLAVLLGAYLGVNQMIDNSRLAPWKPFVWEMSSTLIMVACIPLIVRFERRFRVDARSGHERGPMRPRPAREYSQTETMDGLPRC